MNIIYYHQHFSTPKGATGIRSYEMAQALIRCGHQVTMVCGSYSVGKTGLDGPFVRGRREGDVDGVHVIEFDLSYSNKDGLVRRSWLFAKFALSGMHLALTGSYDRLFATSTPLTAGLPGIIARWLRNKPFIFEIRDLWPELPREMGVIRNPFALGLLSILEWSAYNSAHRCIGLSPGIVDGIARLGVNRSQIALIPNGCDIDIFSDPDIQPWRPHGVNSTDFMAVFAGTHGRANGLDAVLDAAAVLKRRARNDIKIVLIGDGKEKLRLQGRARNEDLQNVIFHPPVSKATLASLIVSADIGLQCLANVKAFYYGTSPNKFFDYIAAGIPVMTNYPGWVADLINNAECGFVVEPERPEAFADALESASSDRQSLKEMGQRASMLAREQFDRRKLADRWAQWVTATPMIPSTH